MIDVFIDPTFQPAQGLPVFPPVKRIESEPQNPLDREIVSFLRDQREAVPTWRMANTVAAALNPASRSEKRELITRILARITPLVYARFIRRVGRRHLALR
jgi:hypothetical protein